MQKNRDGNTPLDLARRMGHTDVVKLLSASSFPPIASPTVKFHPRRSVLSPSPKRSDEFSALSAQVTAPDSHALIAMQTALFDRMTRIESALADSRAVSALVRGREGELEGVLTDRQINHSDRVQIRKIIADPTLSDYYHAFQMVLNHTVYGCMVAHGKIMGSAKTTPATSKLDASNDVMAFIGQEAPFGILVKMLTSGFKVYDSGKKKEAVNNAATFFISQTNCDQIGERLARELVFKQIEKIREIPSTPQTGFMAKKLESLKRFGKTILKNDCNTPIKELAEKQCEEFLKGAMTLQINGYGTPERVPEFVRFILNEGAHDLPGPSYPTPSPLAPLRSKSFESTCSSLATSDAAELPSLREKMRLFEEARQKDLRSITRLEKMLSPTDELPFTSVSSRGSQDQLLVQAAASHHGPHGLSAPYVLREIAEMQQAIMLIAAGQAVMEERLGGARVSREREEYKTPAKDRDREELLFGKA